MDNADESSLDAAIGNVQCYLDGIRRAEIHRFRMRLSGLTEEQKEGVEALTNRIVARLLDAPTRSLAEAAGSDLERLRNTLRQVWICRNR